MKSTASNHRRQLVIFRNDPTSKWSKHRMLLLRNDLNLNWNSIYHHLNWNSINFISNQGNKYSGTSSSFHCNGNCVLSRSSTSFNFDPSSTQWQKFVRLLIVLLPSTAVLTNPSGLLVSTLKLVWRCVPWSNSPIINEVCLVNGACEARCKNFARYALIGPYCALRTVTTSFFRFQNTDASEIFAEDF